MNVVGTKRAIEFGRRYLDAKSQVDSWVHEAKAARWSSPLDIKRRYPHASILAGNRVVFNIRGNNYRLVADIDYDTQTVLIVFIGTHAEYSRRTF
jgi:mRNA interferase HigB